MKIVIFCGGHGTRLWPISRKSYPKPFVQIIKGKSFFQITYERYRKRFNSEDIFISTEDRYVKFVKEQEPEIKSKNIICEPERKDTLAAVGLSIAIINKMFPGEVVLISWAKHLIARESVFLDAVEAAADYSKETGLIVAIDAKPSYPSEHNGWVKLGNYLDQRRGFRIHEIERHIEKPKEAVAKRLFENGGWLIHTGYKVVKADMVMRFVKEFQPSMYEGLNKIAKDWGTKSQEKTLKAEYGKFKKTSVDYGLYEKMPRKVRATISADMGWEDSFISWELFYKSLITPKNKTIIEGGVDTEILDSKDNLIIGPKGKMIGVIGIKDLCIIDSNDGLLVCRMSDTDKVKDLYKKIESYKSKYTD